MLLYSTLLLSTSSEAVLYVLSSAAKSVVITLKKGPFQYIILHLA